MRAVLRLIPLLAIGASLTACDPPRFMSFPPQVRGNHVDPSQLSELVPGTSTTKDVTSLLGSPTAHATFDDNTWIYISETTKPVIGGTQAVENQQAIALTFDDNGVLKSISHKTAKDAQPVDVVSRVTPSPGSDETFLQQLLGNVGKFNPGSSFGGGGPAPTGAANLGR